MPLAFTTAHDASSASVVHQPRSRELVLKVESNPSSLHRTADDHRYAYICCIRTQVGRLVADAMLASCATCDVAMVNAGGLRG